MFALLLPLIRCNVAYARYYPRPSKAPALRAKAKLMYPGGSFALTQFKKPPASRAKVFAKGLSGAPNMQRSKESSAQNEA